MSSPSQIELNAIAEQLLSIIKTCTDSNNVSETLQALLKQERNKDINDGKHLPGLRSQILANGKILLPILVPESINQSIVDGHDLRTLPPMQVVTANSESKTGQTRIHASVAFGDLTAGRKSTLIFTADGYPTVTEAFRELLAVSGRLITKYYAHARTYDVGLAEKIQGGGYFTTLKLARDEEEQPSNHNTKSSGRSKTAYKEKLTGAYKVECLKKEPNASFSFPSDDDQSSASVTSTIEDDSPISSPCPENSHDPDNSTFPFKDASFFFRSHSRTSSVSSIAANVGACYPREADSTYNKIRFYENHDIVGSNVDIDDRMADMARRKPSNPEFRREYIDEFLSPKSDEYTIVQPTPPRNYIDDSSAPFERHGLYKNITNNYNTRRDW